MNTLIESAPKYYFYLTPKQIANAFTDEFCAELVSTPEFQRLKGISFLGAIDYVFHPNGLPSWRRHNRFQHSIGVGMLAHQYCKTKNLEKITEKTLCAAALLHDIGHGPLSHSLEPIFKEKFSITHHSMGEKIIFGRTSLGNAILKVCRRHKVPIEDITDLLSGDSESPHAGLFSGPLNIDTLEAISRAKSYISKTMVSPPPSLILEAITKNPGSHINRLDNFWTLKGEIYRYLINNEIGRFVDNLCQTYMVENISNFEKWDFLLTEVGLRRKHRKLFDGFRECRRSLRRSMKNGLKVDYSKVQETLERKFIIRTVIDVNRPRDFYDRYVQNLKRKNHPTLSLSLKIPEEVPTLSMPDFF